MITQFLGREDIKQVVKTSSTTIQLNSGSRMLIGGVGVKLTQTLSLDKTLNGIGGIDIGVTIPNSFYYVFVVISGNVEGLVASLNLAPTGFTSYRLIAGFYTDSSGLINSVSDRSNLLNVKRLVAAGNAGQTITANVTDIPFITVTDEAGAWNGSQYTVPYDADITIAGMVSYSVNNIRLKIYKNNVFYKTIGPLIAAGEAFFSLTESFSKHDTLSIRSDTLGTLNNSLTVHHLEITATAESPLVGLL